jgi:urea transporter
MNDLLARLAKLKAAESKVGVYHDNGCLIGMSVTEYLVAERDLALAALAEIVFLVDAYRVADTMDDAIYPALAGENVQAAIEVARTILAALREGASHE